MAVATATNPTIRAATRADADFLAWAILTATRSHVQRGWFDIVLDAPETACLDYLRCLVVTRAESWWHYSRFHVLEHDGRNAAVLCAFRAGDAFPLSQAAMAEVAADIRSSEADLTAMWQRGAYIFTCAMGGGDDVWTIENVATLPAQRNKGFAGMLIEHALAIGRENGFKEAQISFFIGNTRAESTYAKAGFQFAEEKRHPDFEAAAGVPGIRRMRCSLIAN